MRALESLSIGRYDKNVDIRGVMSCDFSLLCRAVGNANYSLAENMSK